MTGLLALLSDKDQWEAFFTYKIEKDLLTSREAAAMRSFIDGEKYAAAAKAVIGGTYPFPAPVKHLINKKDTGKKRTVYTFSETEMMLLKLLSFLLYKYDGAIEKNCYSFRRDAGAKRALGAILATPKINGLYTLKIDISNYFNTINISILLPILRKTLSDDAPLYDFFEMLLTADKAVFNGLEINEKRGVMAGTPTSVFLSNLYLGEMDRYFASVDAIYARYADDIIIFGTQAQIAQYEKKIAAFFEKYKLKINPKKRAHRTGEP